MPTATVSTASIPVVDLSPFLSKNISSTQQRRLSAKEAATKCSQNGCLAITGHGIPAEFLKEAFNLMRELFELSMGDKMKAPHPAGTVPHRGYSAPGKERVFEKAEYNASDAEHKQMLLETQDWKVSGFLINIHLLSFETDDSCNKDSNSIER